jgi:hypothetical protein
MALQVSDDEMKILESELHILFTGLYDDFQVRLNKELDVTTACMYALHTRDIDDVTRKFEDELTTISQYSRNNSIPDTPEDICKLYIKLTNEMAESKKRFSEECRKLSEQFHVKHKLALAEVTERLRREQQEKIKNTHQQLRDLYRCHFLLRERKRFGESIQSKCVKH